MDRLTAKDYLPWACALVGVPIWAFTTFASKSEVRDAITTLQKYVDERHADAINHTDLSRAAMEKAIERETVTLEQIKEVMQKIETRTWEERRLSGRR